MVRKGGHINMPELSHFYNLALKRHPHHTHSHLSAHTSRVPDHFRDQFSDHDQSDHSPQDTIVMRQLLEKAHNDLHICKHWIEELKKQNRVLKDEKEELQATLEAKVAEDAAQSREIMRLNHELQLLKLQLSAAGVSGGVANMSGAVDMKLVISDDDENVVFMFGNCLENMDR